MTAARRFARVPPKSPATKWTRTAMVRSSASLTPITTGIAWRRPFRRRMSHVATRVKRGPTCRAVTATMAIPSSIPVVPRSVTDWTTTVTASSTKVCCCLSIGIWTATRTVQRAAVRPPPASHRQAIPATTPTATILIAVSTRVSPRAATASTTTAMAAPMKTMSVATPATAIPAVGVIPRITSIMTVTITEARVLGAYWVVRAVRPAVMLLQTTTAMTRMAL